jgi:chromosome segregation ATPase
MSLENLNTLISSKQERLNGIEQQIQIIEDEIEKIALDSTEESIDNMLKNALIISNTRQELNAQKDVLVKAASITRQELSALLEQLQEVKVEDYLKQLRERATECNETLERLKTQFSSLRTVAAKLSTLPIKRQPITYSYRANLPRLRIMKTTVFIEENLRSSLDTIKWND